MIISFQIDENIYSNNIILETLDIFSEYWDIKYENWVLIIQWENKNEIDELFHEFCNYMLFITN